MYDISITFGRNLGLTRSTSLEDTRRGTYRTTIATLWWLHLIVSRKA